MTGHSNKLKIVTWDQDKFLRSEFEWQTLLKQSNANPVFMSWQWMLEWWNVWGQQSGDELFIIAVYDQSILVGLAPLYKTVSHLGSTPLTIKRIELLGTRYQGQNGVRSEYLQFLSCHEQKDVIMETLLQAIHRDQTWDELILCNMTTVEHSAKIALHFFETQELVRVLDNEGAYSINCKGSYSDYIQALGKNTRLKLFNRRKALHELGEVEYCPVKLNIDSNIFDEIDKFHLTRFGKAAFTEKYKKHLIHAIRAQERNSKNEYSSILKLNGNIISAMLNISYGSTIYNIQLGFEEALDKRISVGLLHLGYALEQAFQSDSISSFDLLAGAGKNNNYKERIADRHATLETRQFIRPTWLKFLYLVNDKFVSKIRSFFGQHL